MILFDADGIASLSERLAGEALELIGISAFGVGLHFGDIEVSCEEALAVRIGGVEYTWSDKPNATPFGLLIGQIVVNIELVAPDRARIHLNTGDFVEILTAESLYESVIVRYPSDGTKLVMDIY